MENHTVMKESLFQAWVLKLFYKTAVVGEKGIDTLPFENIQGDRRTKHIQEQNFLVTSDIL